MTELHWGSVQEYVDFTVSVFPLFISLETGAGFRGARLSNGDHEICIGGTHHWGEAA